jgi:hypothetical protein
MDHLLSKDPEDVSKCFTIRDSSKKVDDHQPTRRTVAISVSVVGTGCPTVACHFVVMAESDIAKAMRLLRIAPPRHQCNEIHDKDKEIH